MPSEYGIQQVVGIKGNPRAIPKPPLDPTTLGHSKSLKSHWTVGQARAWSTPAACCAASVVDALGASPVLVEVHDVVVRARVEDVVLAIDAADAVAVLVDARLMRADPLEGDVAHCFLPVA